MHTENNLSDNQKNDLSVINLLASKGKVKILYYLSQNEELNITQIVKLTHLNSTQVNRHLNFFVENQIVKEKRFGRVKIYSLMTNHYRIRLLKTFFTHWK
ncbi:MAG: ArsR family transcriptional regulator [Candidatus Lokiarchaeota archaeon]|nr:ArsR family transcriptional regulator [Candidatus Lokiarchaeota archaeon]